MKKRSALVYITEEEFNAICEAWDNINSQCEAAGEEYMKLCQPSLDALNNLRSKFLQSEQKADERNYLIEEVQKKLNCTKKQAIAAIKKHRS